MDRNTQDSEKIETKIECILFWVELVASCIKHHGVLHVKLCHGNGQHSPWTKKTTKQTHRPKDKCSQSVYCPLYFDNWFILLCVITNLQCHAWMPAECSMLILVYSEHIYHFVISSVFTKHFQMLYVHKAKLFCHKYSLNFRRNKFYTFPLFYPHTTAINGPFHTRIYPIHRNSMQLARFACFFK